MAVIASQSQRKYYFDSFIWGFPISYYITVSIVSAIMGITAIFRSNSLIQIILIIIAISMTIISHYKLIVDKNKFQYEVLYINSYVLILTIYAISLVYNMLNALINLTLSSFFGNINIILLYFNIINILYSFLIYYKTIQSWNNNLSVNNVLLFRYSPYIRYFPVNKEYKKSSSDIIENLQNRNTPLFPIAYCILFPNIITKKSIYRFKYRYFTGKQSKNNNKYISYILSLLIPIIIAIMVKADMSKSKFWTLLILIGFQIIFALAIFALIRGLVFHQKIRAIEKAEGITFLPYFLKPQEEADADYARLVHDQVIEAEPED